MAKLFISHSSQDDDFVCEFRTALADQGQSGWIDSRELRGGDPLWTEIQQAIEIAAAYAIVVSTDALQSKWVGKELRHALEVQKQRGKDKFPVIPLSLDGTKLGVLEEFFGEEPVYIPISSGAGGIEAAMNAILVALGKRDPADVASTPQSHAEPLEELVLELTDLKFHKQDGKRRASARARLVYEPAATGQREVASAQQWRLIAPIGPIETEELRWYLEKYAIWPSHYFQDRARKVEKNLVQWGRLLHEAAMPVAHTANVMNAWSRIDGYAGRRFSIHVDTALVADAPETEVAAAREAATLLLGLPWELLHDGNAYLFQGAKPTRVRRRLPNTQVLDVSVVAPPIRILLITARPEDDACDYIDHRASALPLVEAMESLPGLVKLHVLDPPTLPALHAELDRARDEKKPYHVVHFDGHGVYDRNTGLGGLCLEEPQDTGKLEKRRHVTVFTDELGPLLRDHRIPLVFLEACQTAKTEQASESVASELLKTGVASVVAMSHSVLVETARRFVSTFYRALADGKRVGDAMLAGQRQLKDDNFRGQIFGAGELRLEDWFVPVLFQEKDDPQLFTSIPSQQTLADFRTALAARLGELPPPPETGFIGRSRELLALQRLLRVERYAVVRGQGGEGKTALAVEFARWGMRSQQIHRVAFVSVETHSHAAAVLDALGRQLVGAEYSAAIFETLEKAILPVERALREQSTLLIMDNMESILLPPFMAQEIPEALSDEAHEELKAILALCKRLLTAGETRLIFTSREALPAPFNAERNRRELHRLDRDDAVKLVERVLNAASGDAGAASNAARESIEQLVDAVHCHARTLALLAPALRSRGVEATRESLIALMNEMAQKFPIGHPNAREQSVFASVELSLRRLSTTNRERVRVLGVFHGGIQLGMLGMMMQWKEADVTSLAIELIETGLATPDHYNHLTLNPALCPYLRAQLNAEAHESLITRWVEAMYKYVESLSLEINQKPEIVAILTVLELPNFFVLLDLVQRIGNTKLTISLVTSLYNLLRFSGKPRLLTHLRNVCNAKEIMLGTAWNHALFQVAQIRIEQQLASGQIHEAVSGAHDLLQCARVTGKQVYSNADYDLAMAYLLLARSLKMADQPEQALPLLSEAHRHFEVITNLYTKKSAAQMLSRCFAEQSECLHALGRLDEAMTAGEEGIRIAEQFRDYRQVAAIKANLGWILIDQCRYPEALTVSFEALEYFMQVPEPVSGIWHQIGVIYQHAGQPVEAEDAYRKSLKISVELGDVAGQAKTLGQLGWLYDEAFGRFEEAITFSRQSIDKFIEVGDLAREVRQRSNLAITLRKLRHFEDARQEIRRVIECKAAFGHASSPWVSWAILADIEADAGNPSAAAKASAKAIASYLAYRRDGGENHAPYGRTAFDVTESLLAGDSTTAASMLQQLADDPDLPSNVLTFIRALQAITSGNRDRSLADAPGLDYRMAAEILLLIETLEQSR